jgi:hypothetical protein
MKFIVSYQIGLSCFAGLAWAIWITRNRMCLQKKFPEKPTDVVHLALSFLQKWKLLMLMVERSKVETLTHMVQSYARTFKP